MGPCYFAQKKILFFILFVTLLIPSFVKAGASLESSLRVAQRRLEAFDASLNLREKRILKQTSRRHHAQLSAGLQKKFSQREVLKKEVEDLEYMFDLKKRLLHLPGHEDYERGSLNQRRQEEVEKIARMVVPAFEELGQQYKMVRPAILHNFLVNMKIKDQGLCWHWARDLTDRLRSLNLQTFELIWATARGGTLREHNTVVIVSRGHSLSDGLVLDGWKKSGEPFWLLVPEDKKHDWKAGEYYGGR